MMTAYSLTAATIPPVPDTTSAALPTLLDVSALMLSYPPINIDGQCDRLN